MSYPGCPASLTPHRRVERAWGCQKHHPQMHSREELLWTKIPVSKGTKKLQSNPKYGYGINGFIRVDLRRF